MASDVLGPSSAFNCSKEINYADHLYENHILDDVEPQYENSEIIRKILQKTNGFSDSLVSIHEEALNAKENEENIYENIGFIENVLSSISDAKEITAATKHSKGQNSLTNCQKLVSTFNTKINEKNDAEKSENMFTSTFSLTIGKPLTLEVVEPSEKKEQLCTNGYNPPEDPDGEDSDDASFKSSYAKSLIDSFRRSSTSPVDESQSRRSSPSTMQEFKPFVTLMQPIDKEIANIQNSSKIYLPKNTTCPNSKALEQLEKRISSLTDNVLMKDKELEKLHQEISFLKLECNRVKAENRNLKVGLNGGMTLRTGSPFHMNGDSQPNSLSSHSADSDTWTLQQQILSLNAQLEKAELSRRAYEAATRQLVHFLQTINTTLSTVASPESKMESPFTPQNTSELLTNLELSLLQNRTKSNLTPKLKMSPYCNSTKDGSFIIGKSDSCIPSSTNHKHRHKHETRNRVSKESKPNTGASAPDSITSTSSQDSAPLSRVGETKENVEKSSTLNYKEGQKVFDTKERKTKRASPQRRFSISQKIWNSTKKPPLMRSGSVSNLPTELPPLPRVSRAVSTHCVATHKINPVRPNIDGETSETASANSNKLLSAKAKDFFSSLKNIFKTDGDRTSSTVDASTNTKKKLTLPSIHRSSKVKTDPAPLSLPPSAAPTPASQTNLKKRHSLKAQSMHRVSPSEDVERLHHNSIFYVPCFAHNESDDADVDEDNVDGDKEVQQQQQRHERETAPASSTDEGRRSSSSESTSLTETTPVIEELSGPQELSMTLSLEESLQGKTTATETQDKISSGAHFTRLITGGGFSTVGACESDDSSTEGVYGDGMNRVQSFSTSYEGKGGVRDIFSSVKEFPEIGECARYSIGISEAVSRGPSWKRTNAIQRRRSDFDAIGLKHSLWKLARESYRSKECRLAFV